MKIKTVVMCIAFILSYAIPVSAAPFLICDPQTDVEGYLVEIDGVVQPAVSAQSDGSLKFDLVAIGVGSHVFRAMCRSDDMWSEWSVPFDATKGNKPSGFSIVGE